MSRVLTIWCVPMLLFLSQPAAAQSTEGVEVNEVIEQVKIALRDAAQSLEGNSIPPLQTVTVTLLTEVSKKIGGVFKFFVFSFGSEYERVRANEMTLVLAPPKPTPQLVASELAKPLADAIKAAAIAMTLGASSEPRLELGKLTINVSFVVNRKNGGGVKFEVLPVSGELSGNLSKKAVHKVSLEFAVPKKEKET